MYLKGIEIAVVLKRTSEKYNDEAKQKQTSKQTNTKGFLYT